MTSNGFRGRIYENITETIGDTPLVRLSRFARAHDVQADLLAKLEFFNPLASVKDRAGLWMIDMMEKASLITPGRTVLVEPTSGNTGIALAFIAAVRGYRLILTMPESMSVERRKLLKLLGAELVLTPAENGMHGAIVKAQSLIEELPDAVMPQQFENTANPEAHRRTTAEELWRDSGGNLDVLVSGVGTGGTLTGVAEVLKERNPNFHVVAVEPEGSAVISGHKPGPHSIQGIGAGFLPSILNVGIIDEVLRIGNQSAFATAREAARLEGLPCGISSGAALAAAVEVGKRPEMKGKRIAVIIASFAERYLSTELFEGL